MCHTLPVLFSRSSSSISAVIFPSARSSGVHNTKLTAVAADEYTAKFTASFTSPRTRVAPNALAFPRIGASHTPGTATRAGFGFGFGFGFGIVLVLVLVVSAALPARITRRPSDVIDAPSSPSFPIARGRPLENARPVPRARIFAVPPRRASLVVVVVVVVFTARGAVDIVDIVDITVVDIALARLLLLLARARRPLRLAPTRDATSRDPRGLDRESRLAVGRHSGASHDSRSVAPRGTTRDRIHPIQENKKKSEGVSRTHRNDRAPSTVTWNA
tara:strand:+ start:6677 stop:7498 length:822 start_codon:yes stop_codon:yes gene_type:complete